MNKSKYYMPFLLILISFNLKAQWTSNTTLNTAISLFTGDKNSPKIISDGADGAIISWTDYRSGGFDLSIYAQRINSSGVAQWANNGVVICDTTDLQQNPYIISDAAGGAIIAWEDDRNGSTDLYAQKINSSGVVQWARNGIALVKASSAQQMNLLRESIISDGAGGAIIAWDDNRSYPQRNIYCQKVNSAGVVQWATNGVAITTSTVSISNSNCTLIKDGSGGAIITWQDGRNGINNNDIYAQRINSLGVVQWTLNGVIVSSDASHQSWPSIVSDNLNGAIITWLDGRTNKYNVYAQRINALGVAQWTANGVAICDSVSDPSGEQYFPNLVQDGTNGAIITWHDSRSGLYGIYAQKINSLGMVQWTNNGVIVNSSSYPCLNPSIISDGTNGAIIAWMDGRNGVDKDIYAQRTSSLGVAQWQFNGVAVGTATNDQQYPFILKTTNGAIFTFKDKRSGNFDIYAQNIANDGSTYVSINELYMQDEILFYPNPTDGQINFSKNINKPKVYNSIGVEVMKEIFITSADQIDISSLLKGIYFLEILENDKVKRYKLIKE